MSGSVGIIIGEALVFVIQAIAEKAKASGLTDEQVKDLLFDAMGQVLDTKPEDLPTVSER